MNKPFYLTTPLYYVNGEPHLGHAYTTILADVLCRYHRMFGENVYFLTGNDEHGQKVATAAAAAGRDPQEHCDILSQTFIDVWKRLNIEYDDFIRTTEPRHKKVVVDILNRVYQQGDIYTKEYEGWYSVYEERFFTEKDLVDGKDPISHRPVEKLKEMNYFFKMSKYQDWLIDHYTKNPDAVLPEFRLNEVLGFLRKPLGDLCISRPKSRLTWGIPIPWDDDYVTYVWFDALINYYSATIFPPEGKSPVWPADYHLIGKDILTTHAVYWPIMLHAAGLEPPRHILAHGWWLATGAEKMSKSAGNVIKPLDFVDKYGTDPFRYVMMREMVVGQDASLGEKSFVKRVNSDLANDLGNLLNRVAKIQTKHFPEEVLHLEQIEEDEIVELAHGTASLVKKKILDLQIHSAIEDVLQFVRAINRNFSASQPWKTATTDPEQAKDTLARALEGIRIAAVLLSPVIPEKAQELLERVGVEKSEGFSWEDTAWSNTQRTRPVIFADAVFPRVEIPKPKPEKVKETSSVKQPGKGNLVSIDDFKEIDLRTAVILEAETVPETNKLMKLQIDVGKEKRQLVAGIAQHYKADELIGKTIVIVANLQPATIRGVESQGMLLAVRDGKKLSILAPDAEIKPGKRIS